MGSSFLAAYTAVNWIHVSGIVLGNFLAAYTAVNQVDADIKPAVNFLAAYTAVNETAGSGAANSFS